MIKQVSNDKLIVNSYSGYIFINFSSFQVVGYSSVTHSSQIVYLDIMGSYVLSGSSDGNIKIFDLTSNSVVQDFSDQKMSLQKAWIMSNGKLLTCENFESLMQYDLNLNSITSAGDEISNVNPSRMCTDLRSLDQIIILAADDQIRLINGSSEKFYLLLNPTQQWDTINCLEIAESKYIVL